MADSSRFDVYKLVDAAVSGDTARAVRILDNVKSEGIEAPIVVWALTRELRVLVTLAGLATLACSSRDSDLAKTDAAATSGSGGGRWPTSM